jgi:DNA-binding PadR family transcriptional regulator
MAIKYSILGLLHYEDMHGYRIKEHIEKNFGHMWSINYGQIYPNLKKLQEEGLIKMKEIVQNGEKGPPKKLYAITPKGKEEFARWLGSFPEKPMILRDPFLMRFVFYGFGEHDRALEVIEDQISQYEGYLERRKENLEKWHKSGVYVKLISELGVKMNAVFLEWLQTAKAEITLQKKEDSA